MNLEELLKEAARAPLPEVTSKKAKWRELSPVIKTLRDKGYTYKLISEWFTAQGIQCTKADVSQAYKRYPHV